VRKQLSGGGPKRDIIYKPIKDGEIGKGELWVSLLRR